MKIPVALQEEFKDVPYLDVDTFSITFRQGNGTDDDKVLATERKVNRGYWLENQDGSRHYVEESWMPERVTKEKVRLVLVACDLEWPEGGLMFTEDMSSTDFTKSWNAIHSAVRQVIFLKCLEVNPDWTPFWMRGGETNSEP